MLTAVVPVQGFGDSEVPRRLALECAGAFIQSFQDPEQVTGVRWEGRITAGDHQVFYFTDSVEELRSLLEATQRKAVLEQAGAFICSFPDPLMPSGIRWEGTMLAGGRNHAFVSAGPGDLVQRMETTAVLGRVLCALKALPGTTERSAASPSKALPVPTPQSMTWACGSAEPVSRLPTRSPR